MQSSHTFTAGSAVFDERNLVSAAGLVPVLELAEQSVPVGADRLSCRPRLHAGGLGCGANAVGKLTSIVGGTLTGADNIDDVDTIRAGGSPIVFDQMYAPSTLGIFLREFTYGHSPQLGAVLRRHLIGLAARTPLLPGIEDLAYLDIDSLLRPVYGHQKQGAPTGTRRSPVAPCSARASRRRSRPCPPRRRHR
ncbi:hypothetical protein Rwratislav_01832 [Rhodococcus wratislaviensis IFP 2016]|nr:hypothetical protein Rwratislav_01832 [Rhodococcus wratislaviensis IFP 2016]